MPSKKILIAEDDRFLANAYKVKLENEGYEVELAEDGAVTLSLLGKNHYDLLILDLMMPKKDGFTVLTKINTTSTLRDLPVIVATNLGLQRDIDRARKLGARDYIIKSDSSMLVVLAKVRKILEGSHA